MHKEWEIQHSFNNPWFSLGVHIDHTDPSITIHLPFLIIYAGNCKQPGLRIICERCLAVKGDWDCCTVLDNVEELDDHQAMFCECGSVSFQALKSGKVECSHCHLRFKHSSID